MANLNPRSDNLELGRGKKPQLGHKAYKINLNPAVRERLDEIAEAYGCIYGGKGSLSILLTKIAEDELMIAPSLSYQTPSSSYQTIRKKLNDNLISKVNKYRDKKN